MTRMPDPEAREPAMRELLGQCPHRAIQFVALLDGSCSTTAWDRPTRHDRPSVLTAWHREVRIAVRHVAQSCDRCADDPTTATLASVVHFDPGGPYDRKPTPLTRSGVRKVAASLTVPREGTGSALGHSLSVAERHAASRPDLLTVVVVFSDFELFDLDVDGVLDRLGAFPGRPYAVVLGNDAPARLRRDRRIGVTEIRWNSPPGSVARATLAALTPHWDEPALAEVELEGLGLWCPCPMCAHERNWPSSA